MLIALILSLIILIIAYFVPVLTNWHIFNWIGEAADNPVLLEMDKWGWYISLSFAFTGAGMMTPLNTAVSMFLGQGKIIIKINEICKSIIKSLKWLLGELLDHIYKVKI